MYVTNEGTWLNMHECAVVQPHNACVFFVHGAGGRLQGCRFSPWKPKAALQARNEGTCIEVEGCTVTPMQRFRLLRKLAQVSRARWKCLVKSEDHSSATKEFWAVDGAEITVVHRNNSRGHVGGGTLPDPAAGVPVEGEDARPDTTVRSLLYTVYSPAFVSN